MKLSYALVSAVLMSGVFAATQAVAEDPHHDDHHAAPQAGGHGGPPPGGHGGAPPAGGHPGGPPGGHPGGAMTGPPRGGPPHGNSMMGPSHGNNNTMMMNGHNAGTAHNPPNRNFDRHSYQRNFVAPRRFHANVYVRPHGWYEHRWVFGEILPALFWSQNYWLSDYNDYGLGDPPPGFVWVRYGSDALLVDQNSGEVLQVEYDVFY
jgi:Ni/Co efflux regulator RcnB